MPSKVVILRSVMASGVTVDREAGVIRRVPVITAGQTKPSGGGHGSFDVDAVTLQQVADAINNKARIRSRITHPEVEGVDGIDRRVGHFMNATVEGSKVYADFTFGKYATLDKITLLCGLVEEEPDDIGVSIVSDTATIEPSPGTVTGLVLRLTQLDAIDWTEDPAANPAGMLSAVRTTERTTTMFTQQQLDFLHGVGLPEDAPADSIPAFVEGLDEDQKKAFEAIGTVAPAAPPTEPTEPVSAMESEDEKPVSTSEDEDEKPVSMSSNDFDKAVALSLQKARQRDKQIRQIALKAGRDEQWITQQIESDASVGDIALSALNTLTRSPADMKTSSSKITVGADNNRDTLGQAVQDALMLRAGRRQFVKFDGSGQVVLSANRQPETRQAHERANEFRGHSVIEMGRRWLLALGYDKADSMQRPQLASLLMSRSKLQAALPGVYLAHSTSDFPFLLADSMGKVLRGEYALAPDTWSFWCRQTTAPDFKDIKALQLSEAADLVLKPEGDDIEYGTLTETKETYALSTYAKGIKFTREMLINDDLSAFDRVPRLMGRAAARKVESIAIAILTANANLADGIALFASGHSNLTTGALTVSSLGTARSLMRRQASLGSSDPLELTPRYLIVPETIASVAEQLVGSSVDPAKSNNTPNLAFIQGLSVISSARLDSNSTAQWYLAADPSEIDTVEVAFLEGEEAPVVEEEDEFDSDTRKVKVRHNIAAKAIDHRGMLRSSGS